jgi:hypothetical protein
MLGVREPRNKSRLADEHRSELLIDADLPHPPAAEAARFIDDVLAIELNRHVRLYQLGTRAAPG